MPWYVINTPILIPSLRARIPEVKQVWLVDDSAGGGLMERLYNWYIGFLVKMERNLAT